MRNIGIVIKHEIISTITKPSFWVTTLLLPALIMVFTFGSQFFSMQVLEEEMDPTEFIQTETTTPAIGYVDHAGIVTRLPEGYSAERMRAFPDEAAAQAALDAGELQSYYVVATDFIETGNLVAVEPEFAR
jgi:hypothetical protein